MDREQQRCALLRCQGRGAPTRKCSPVPNRLVQSLRTKVHVANQLCPEIIHRRRNAPLKPETSTRRRPGSSRFAILLTSANMATTHWSMKRRTRTVWIAECVVSQITSVTTAGPDRPEPLPTIQDPPSGSASFSVRPRHPRPSPRAPAARAG